jgi:hypothetical protein
VYPVSGPHVPSGEILAGGFGAEEKEGVNEGGLGS